MRDYYIEAAELGRFVATLLPDASPPEQTYFRVMLDFNDDGAVTFPELIEAIKEARAVEMGAAELAEAARRLGVFMRRNGVAARRAFDALDADRSGKAVQVDIRLTLG